MRPVTGAPPALEITCASATIAFVQGTSTSASPVSEVSAGARETALRLGALLRYLFLFDRGQQLRAIEESGLSFTQSKALLVLAADNGGGPCPGRELAEKVGLSEGTISRAVEGLVEAGYATRVEDAEDRRVRRIAITAVGEEAVGRIVAARLAGLEEFSAGLTAAERRKLDAALGKLLERPELAKTYEQIREQKDS